MTVFWDENRSNEIIISHTMSDDEEVGSDVVVYPIIRLGADPRF